MLRKLAIFKSEKYVHMVAFFGITSWGRFWNTNFFRHDGGRCDAKRRFSNLENGFAGCNRFSHCARLEAMLRYFERNVWGRSLWNDRFSKNTITQSLLFWTKFIGVVLMKWSIFISQNHVSHWPPIFSRHFLKLVMHGYTILNGGDLDKNGNCKVGKPVIHG